MITNYSHYFSKFGVSLIHKTILFHFVNDLVGAVGIDLLEYLIDSLP